MSILSARPVYSVDRVRVSKGNGVRGLHAVQYNDNIYICVKEEMVRA